VIGPRAGDPPWGLGALHPRMERPIQGLHGTPSWSRGPSPQSGRDLRPDIPGDGGLQDDHPSRLGTPSPCGGRGRQREGLGAVCGSFCVYLHLGVSSRDILSLQRDAAAGGSGEWLRGGGLDVDLPLLRLRYPPPRTPLLPSVRRRTRRLQQWTRRLLRCRRGTTGRRRSCTGEESSSPGPSQRSSCGAVVPAGRRARRWTRSSGRTAVVIWPTGCSTEDPREGSRKFLFLTGVKTHLILRPAGVGGLLAPDIPHCDSPAYRSLTSVQV